MPQLEDCPAWVTHAELAAGDPGERDYMRQLEATSRREDREQGKAHKIEPAKFTCEGRFHFFEMNKESAHWCVACTGCDRELAVPQDTIDPTWRYRYGISRSHLPKLLLETEMAEYPWQAKARSAMRRWCKGHGDRAPLLVGPVNTGKTHLLTAAGKWLIQNGREVRYWTMTDLLDQTRRSYDTAKAEGLFYGAQQADVLILDDLGAERPTEWAADRLQALIDIRYRQGRPILGATNLHPNEWDEAFGPRIASRLERLCNPVEIYGESGEAL